MYCPKCEKDLPADSAFCPYCGNEKLTEKAETVETPDTVEAVEATPASEQRDGDRNVPGKSGKTAVIVILAVLVAIAAIAAAFAVGYMISKNNSDVPGITEGELFPDDYETTYPDGYVYAEANLSKYISLGEYKGLTVELTTGSEVTDADMKEFIDTLLAQYATLADVTDRAAKEGDTVVIDFAGTVDGVAFEGGTAADQTLTIGAGGYIDGFEDGIIGMNIGETKTIDATFPEDYGKEELNGKSAQFAITLDSIQESVLPEYDDTFVREYFEYDTMAEFETELREYLTEEREYEILNEKQSGILAMVMDNATVKAYPDGLVEDYMKQQVDYLKSYAEMYSMTYDDLCTQMLGMTAAEYEAEVRASAEYSVKQEMLVYAIYQAEKLTVTEEERTEAENYYLEYYGAEDVAALCEQTGITETYFTNMIDFAVVSTVVMDFLTENTTYTGAK